MTFMLKCIETSDNNSIYMLKYSEQNFIDIWMSEHMTRIT